MRLQPIKLPTLTIASSGSNSNGVTLTKKAYRSLAIFGPAALTGTVKVAVSADGGSTYQVLQSGGSDIEIAAGKCVTIDIVAFDRVRVQSDASEAAQRQFELRAVEELR